MLDPQSSHALAISDLFNIVMAIALVILALVTGLVVYAIIKFRHQPGNPDPQPVFGNRNIEIAWTIGPLIIIGVLFVLTMITMGNADPSVQSVEASSGSPDLVIVGHQWWWEVRYPKANVTTANEIHLPAGQQMVTRLESADVIHNFWVPSISRKEDLTPGHPTLIALKADRPGDYPGACGEFCGVAHAWMLLKVIVQPPNEFNAWLTQQSQAPPMPISGQYALAVKTFQQKTCISCHALGNQGAHVGPDLSHIGSRTTIAAGALPNTSQNLYKWLQNPQAVKPGVLMPNVQLTNDELNALVAYFESLK